MGAVAGCAIFLAAAAPPAWAQSAQTLSFGPGRPVPQGDASKGRHVFDAVCWACHSADLSGGKAPPLTGSAFYRNWQGKPADALSGVIRNTMPRDEPGLLSDEMARDVTAYIVTYANRPANRTGEQTGK